MAEGQGASALTDLAFRDQPSSRDDAEESWVLTLDSPWLLVTCDLRSHAARPSTSELDSRIFTVLPALATALPTLSDPLSWRSHIPDKTSYLGDPRQVA